MLILLTASIPGFITGASIYGVSVRGMEHDLREMHQKQIGERVANIDDQLGYLEVDLSHWAFSPRFGYPLQELDFVYHFQETWDISKSLVILEGSHPLIRGVNLYIRPLQVGEPPVLFNTGYYELKDAERIADYEQMLGDRRSIYWRTGRAAEESASQTGLAEGPGGSTTGSPATETGSLIGSPTTEVDVPIESPSVANRPHSEPSSARNRSAPDSSASMDSPAPPDMPAPPDTPAPTAAQDAPLMLIHQIPGGSTEPFGVLLLTVDRAKMVNLLKTMTPYNAGATFLMDSSGRRIVSDDRAAEDLYDRLQEEVRTRQQMRGEDTFLWEQGGKTFAVSYGSFMRVGQGWSYVSAAPVTAITAPVVAMSRTILTISGVGLALALLLSWLTSMRVYSPVARLLSRLGATEQGPGREDEFGFIERQWQSAQRESLHLRARLDDQLPHLRSGFLLQLLQGHLYAYSEHDLRKQLERYGWETEGHQYHLMHLRLTGYSRLSGRFPHGDENLVTFAAANIVEELTAEAFAQHNVMNFHDLSLCLIVASEPGSDVIEPLDRLAARIVEMVNRMLQLQVILAISRPLEEMRRVAETFMEVERASALSPALDQNQVIRLGAHPPSCEERAGRYPFAVEAELVQAMRSGRLRTAERLAEGFLDELLSYPASHVQIEQSVLQLLGSLLHMMLQTGSVPLRLYGGANLYEELSQLREPDKMIAWLKARVIAPFMTEREQRAGEQLRGMVEQTVSYMKAHFATAISLEICADLAGVSPYTLSKVFKQLMGINFIDYLTELRLAKAKELLRESELQIAQVAESVGYQQRYFNRIFKKHVGVTPSEYRSA
ncbi:AraC family transcriptional regulator [Paenibacillus sp. IB182496]|uniref:AraC family transcriptional regulator n=1 Tax=Paenibacillus sabuli TaxID=2772509 RepID=A0A927BQC3_9BACL|nr:AraC family transcriptional regulator [Paenibacillus sabuli]MBD2843815.1 AraC family transcriptional regulator [Paenibacillus sabuli]